MDLDCDVDDPVQSPKCLADHIFPPVMMRCLLGDDEITVPFCKQSPRLIVYEMKRKKVEGLPAVPGERDDLQFDDASTADLQEHEFQCEENECSPTSDFMLNELGKRLQGNEELEKSFSSWFEKQHVERQRRFYRHVNAHVVNSNGYMTEYNSLLTLLTASHTAALPLGSSEQALAAMFYLTVSCHCVCLSMWQMSAHTLDHMS